MRNLVVILLSLVPAVALAQPAPPDPNGPPGPPGPPPPYAPPPPASGPGFAPYVAPVYTPPPPTPTFHRGTTFEANLGIGFIHASAGGVSDNSNAALGGLDLGVGGWLSDHLALTVRIAGLTYSEGGGRFTDAFFGPSLQYWFDDHLWAGGGAGLGVLAVGATDSQANSDSVGGFSLDLRAGYSFASSSAHTFNISVELNPGWYSEGGASASYTGVALLAGYQYL
jgi:hypothetical protein